MILSAVAVTAHVVSVKSKAENWHWSQWDSCRECQKDNSYLSLDHAWKAETVKNSKCTVEDRQTERRQCFDVEWWAVTVTAINLGAIKLSTLMTWAQLTAMLIFALLSILTIWIPLTAMLIFGLLLTLMICNQYILCYFYTFDLLLLFCHEFQEVLENHHNTWKDANIASFLYSK